MADSDGGNQLSTAYDQLCTSYRAIDDFRAKLLGFLPLVTGGGLILLTGRADEVRREFFAPVGLFGIAVTTGLLAYEIFGIKKCHALIEGGIALEKELRLPHAQFTRRPNNVLHVVNEPFCRSHLPRRPRGMDLPGTLLRSPQLGQDSQPDGLRHRVRRDPALRPELA